MACNANQFVLLNECFWKGKGFIQCRRRMRIRMIENQSCFRHGGIFLIQLVFEAVGEIPFGAGFFHQAMTPTSERFRTSGRWNTRHCAKTLSLRGQDDLVEAALVVGDAQATGKDVHRCRQRERLRRRGACTDRGDLPSARQIPHLPWEDTTLL